MLEFLAQMAQASTLLQPSPVFCSLLEKLGKPSNIFWSIRGVCSGLLPSWSLGITPATSCSRVRRSELQHGNTDISRMHMSGRGHKCWQRRDDATSIPLVHTSSSSALSHWPWPGDFSCQPSGQVNHSLPAGLQLARKEITWQWRKQEWQHSFLETQGPHLYFSSPQ